MDSFRKLKVSIGFFTVASVAVLLVAIGIFYYLQAHLSQPQVLGETVTADANSLFGAGISLIKATGDNKVYAVVANQKYPIRNEEVFTAYDFSFQNVKTVSATEIEKYPLANLVKELETGRIYYLSYGKNLKKYHPSPAAFNVYPGNRWGNVITVSQKDLSFWQEANLLKAVNDNKVYYVKGDKKAWIKTENEFINVGFDWRQILTVFAADLNTYTDIDFSVELLKPINPVNENENVSQPQVSGGQVVVTLDGMSPAAKVLPVTTANNIASVFKLQAVGQNIIINSITLTRTGVSNNDAINFISLEDENGVIYATLDRMDNNRPTEIRFDERKFIIPKSTEKKLIVKVNIAASAQHNGTFAIGIDKIGDINASGEVSGIFPIFGSDHKIVAIQDFLGVVNVVSNEVNSELRYINIGMKQDTVAKFTLTETSGNEDVAVYKISLYNEGTAGDDDLDYIYLYEGSKLIAATGTMINGIVTFNLSAQPLVIKQNGSVDLDVKVDVAKGEGHTLKFVINQPSDILLKGLAQKFELVCQSHDGFPLGEGSGSNYNLVSFKQDGIGFFAKKLDEDEREVYRDTVDVSFGEFELRNISEDIFLQRIRIQVEKFNNAPDLTADLKLVNVTNPKDPKTIMTIDKNRLTGGTIADVNLGNFPITASQTVNINILSNVPDTAQFNNSYRVVVRQLTYKIGSDNTEYAYNSTILGPVMRVFAPQLAITPADLKNQGVGQAGETKVELASFKLLASVDERVTIKSITVSLLNSSDDVSYTAGFANLALYVGGYRKSNLIEQPNSNTYTFNNLNISVSAGRSLDIMVKADTAIITDSKNIIFKIDDVIAQGYSSRAPVLIEGEGTASRPVILNAGTLE